MTGAPVSSAEAAIDREDARDVADHPVRLDGALEECGLDARVVDALADLAHEQLDDLVVRAVPQESGQLEEGVDAGRDDDVEIDLGVDPLDARDVAAERTRCARVDERLDAAGAQSLQLLDRVGDAHVLIPVALPPDVVVVLDRHGIGDEDVLVHQRRPEPVDVDRPADGLNGRQSSVLSLVHQVRRAASE